MIDRTEVYPDREQFATLMEVKKWYDAMPTCLHTTVHDSFGEDVESFILQKLPEIPETNLDDGYFISSMETNGDTLVVDICNDDTGEHSHNVTFV